MTIASNPLPPVEQRSAAPEILVATSRAPAPEKRIRRQALVLRVFLLAAAVAVLVSVGAGLVARQLAESEAIRQAAERTGDIALDIVQPALLDGITSNDPAAVRRLDTRVRESVVGREIARVKLWTASGRIIYSDEPRIVGARFGLDDEELETLESGGTQAEISDLGESENRYERGFGSLLEVYRAVHTPNGTPLLFEVYYRYDDVETASQRIWVRFAEITGASLLLLLLTLLPLLGGLVRSVERAREDRELSLLKALDASDSERRRIAAAVHDGPVQDLIGASYRLGAAAADARGSELEPAIAGAEEAVRSSVEGLRDTLVDLYPAALAEAGLAGALGDLVAAARSHGSIVLLRVEDDLPLPAAAERLVYRIARETIANAVKHGGGTPVRVDVRKNGRSTVLTVHDDGPGFDAAAVIHTPPAGHFGIRLLRDAVQESGVDAQLSVESGPGSGTTWRLAVD